MNKRTGEDDYMKTLVIYDYDGNVISTMSKISKLYGLDEVEIDLTIRKIVGYDLEDKKLITASKDLSDTKFNKMKDELMKKNELYNAKDENKTLKIENRKLNGEIKESIKRLENANVEILDMVTELNS